MSSADDKTLSILHDSLADAQRIADLADNMTKYTVHYVNDKLEFSNTVIADIKLMDTQLSELFEESMRAFNDDDVVAKMNAEELESKIDAQKKHIIDGHIRRLNEGKCQPQSSSVLINLVGNIERAADHIVNIAHSYDRVK